MSAKGHQWACILGCVLVVSEFVCDRRGTTVEVYRRVSGSIKVVVEVVIKVDCSKGEWKCISEGVVPRQHQTSQLMSQIV